LAKASAVSYFIAKTGGASFCGFYDPKSGVWEWTEGGPNSDDGGYTDLILSLFETDAAENFPA
jgi:hypothetical protein